MITTTREQDQTIENLALEHGRVRVCNPTGRAFPGSVWAIIIVEGRAKTLEILPRGGVLSRLSEPIEDEEPPEAYLRTRYPMN